MLFDINVRVSLKLRRPPDRNFDRLLAQIMGSGQGIGLQIDVLLKTGGTSVSRLPRAKQQFVMQMLDTVLQQQGG